MCAKKEKKIQFKSRFAAIIIRSVRCQTVREHVCAPISCFIWRFFTTKDNIFCAN